MKYKILILIILLTSCSAHTTRLENRSPYISKGFAYIYNEHDYENKIIKGKLDNSKLQVSHSKLSHNTLIKIINPKTNESITIKNHKKINYPDFYKILITERVANKLNMLTIAFLGKGGGLAKDFSEKIILIPSNSTARIQEMHIFLGHIICELVESELGFN